MSTIQEFIRNSVLPVLEAQMLLQHITGLSRTGLITHAHDPLSDTHMIQLDALTTRRIHGEPMAYILGSREFYGRSFVITPDVLIPRPDTETLIETILEHTQAQHSASLSLLDLGTGSGIIAITLALECPKWQVFATDISSTALSVAQRNATQLNTSIQFHQSDWLSALDGQTFDLIISNPPYIEANDPHLSLGDLRFEPQIALTDYQNGLTNYEFLIDTVPDYLNKNGQLWFEHGYNQAAAIRDLLRQKGYVNIMTFTDLSGIERVTKGQIPHQNHHSKDN